MLNNASKTFGGQATPDWGDWKCGSIESTRVENARLEITTPKARVAKCGSESVRTRLQGWRIRNKQIWTARSDINKTYL